VMAISTKTDGLRERKKRETMERIAKAGLKLFVKNGYEATTLDEIAAESGIARRTFFYYFKSKEAILMAYIDGGYVKTLPPTLLAQSTDQTPLAAVYNSLLQLVSAHETEQAIVVDKLLGSTEALQVRRQAAYTEMEQAVFEALCQMWPKMNPGSLRIIAMASIGAMRVAKDTWRREGGKLPLAQYLRETFTTLENEI
jgi:AcrR family transcriptional regulator